MTGPGLPANTELVAVHWLGTLDHLSPKMVATVLPADTSTWASSGFVTIGAGGGASASVIGGSVDYDTRLRNPILQVDCWAVKPGSTKPPWGQANTLAEYVIAGCFDPTKLRVDFVPLAGFQTVRVLEARPITDARRIPGDEGSYARFTLDLQLHWVSLD